MSIQNLLFILLFIPASEIYLSQAQQNNSGILYPPGTVVPKTPSSENQNHSEIKKTAPAKTPVIKGNNIAFPTKTDKSTEGRLIQLPEEKKIEKENSGNKEEELRRRKGAYIKYQEKEVDKKRLENERRKKILDNSTQKAESDSGETQNDTTKSASDPSNTKK
jgi:hypothetical protein